MSWEVSNLIINDDSGIKIVNGGTSLTNVKPSNIYAQYQTDAPNYGSMNRNANTILLGKGNSSAGYNYTHGLTLPTDKTIYIQTDQNDGNVWFYWEGISSSSDFGSNAWSMRDFNIAQYYEPYGFNFAGTAYNFYGGVTGKIINSKTYYAQTWLGSSAQFLPLIWTTIPLSNFIINGEKYDSSRSGGAGSGYIGDHGLVNKKMVGFNVMTSDDPDTKTESVEEAYELPVAGKPKIGNGFCRIKFLRSVEPPNGFKIYNLDDEIGCKCYFNSMHVKTVRDVVQIVENANLGNIITFLDTGWTWTGLNIEPKSWSSDSVYLYDKNYDHDTGSSVCYIGIKDVYSSPAPMYMLNGDGTAIAFSEARTHNWSSKSGEPFPQGYCYANYDSTSVTCNYEGGIYIPKSINVYLNDQLYRSAM